MPLLSAWDISQLMQVFVINQMSDPNDVIKQIFNRHLNR
jgi:hypothetical protein